MKREIYNLELAGRLACTDDERDRCAGTLYYIMALASTARKKGLPAIGPQKDNPRLPAFLREALALIRPDMENGDLRRELESRIGPDDSGGELLEKLVIIEGSELLVNGFNPNTILNALSLLFIDEYVPRLRRHIAERARR